MNQLLSWINDDNKWIVMALLFGLAVLMLVGLVHSGRTLRRLGARKELD